MHALPAYPSAGAAHIVADTPLHTAGTGALTTFSNGCSAMTGVEAISGVVPSEGVTVFLPEFVPARWWRHLLHNQSALLITGALLFRRHTVVTSVPFHLER